MRLELLATIRQLIGAGLTDAEIGAYLRARDVLEAPGAAPISASGHGLRLPPDTPKPCLPPRPGGEGRKLTPADVYVIRDLYDRGVDTGEIARHWGISRMHVIRVGRREQWQHLPERGGT